jgi:hypothetical protein
MTTTKHGWVPAFEGQRPPFEPGHELSLRHGGYSPRKVEPLAQQLVDLVLDDPETAYLTNPRWRPALWAWARAEAQVQLVTEWLTEQAEDGVGDLDEASVRAAHLLLHRAESRATSGRTRLGLDPLSAARLGRDRAASAVDMARVMQELKRRDDAEDGGHQSDRDVIDVDPEETP